MADGTKIEWARGADGRPGATWNPITGCSVKSPGCINCYAQTLAGGRLRNHPSRVGLTTEAKTGPIFNGNVRFNEAWLDQPLRWSKPRTIFVCAHGDLFHEHVPDAWIDRVWAVMAVAHQHTFQVLTKRADRMRAYVDGLRREPGRMLNLLCALVPHQTGLRPLSDLLDVAHLARPLPNVWLGVSAERQQEADERIPDLLATSAAVRWLSAEPLLGPLDLRRYVGQLIRDAIGGYELELLTPHPRLNWVVAGGESGQNARPMHHSWVRRLRDQCAVAGVSFFFKQWGAWAPIMAMSEDLTDRCYQPAPARHPEAPRQPRVARLVMHSDGAVFDRHAPGERGQFRLGAYAAGSDAMLMFMVGKTAAGRSLDGRTHDAFPGAPRAEAA